MPSHTANVVASGLIVGARIADGKVDAQSVSGIARGGSRGPITAGNSNRENGLINVRRSLGFDASNRRIFFYNYAE